MKGFHEENEFEKYACLFKIMCPLKFGNITQIDVREVNFEKSHYCEVIFKPNQTQN